MDKNCPTNKMQLTCSKLEKYFNYIIVAKYRCVASSFLLFYNRNCKDFKKKKKFVKNQGKIVKRHVKKMLEKDIKVVDNVKKMPEHKKKSLSKNSVDVS